MGPVAVVPVQIIGSCPVAITVADEFEIRGMCVHNPAGHNVCFLAVAQIPIGQGIWQLQSGERFFSHVSCPGCSSDPDAENRVVFLLSLTDRRVLSEAISEYMRLCQVYPEPASASQLKRDAIECQSRGDFVTATRYMLSALERMRRSAGEPPQHTMQGTGATEH